MLKSRMTIRDKTMLKLAAASVLCMAGAQPSLAASTHRAGGVSAYNGAWMVSSEGPCTGIGSGQVTIMNGRIIGPNGAGRVSPGGAVHTITNVNGVTTVSDGLITGGTASGSYRQSTGCSGIWTAVKL